MRDVIHVRGCAEHRRVTNCGLPPKPSGRLRVELVPGGILVRLALVSASLGLTLWGLVQSEV
jgi:hypothetical protein